jgi:hypothetical protein
MTEERYVDCEICDQRFVGESIRSYIQEIRGRDICIGCVRKESRGKGGKRKIPLWRFQQPKTTMTQLDCSWCGGACDQPRPYRNRRGEAFCSPDHRTASNCAFVGFKYGGH